MNFDFLKSVELTTPETSARTGRVAAEKLPSGLMIRVFASGKIYPSKELVEVYSLEYAAKDSTELRKGFDVFSSKNWPMFPMNAPEHYIFVTVVDKKSPKVDLFGQVGYEEDGSPKSSVLEQGGGSFGADFLEMIKDVYGIEIPKGEYRDFELRTDIPIKSPNDVYFIPKTVARGANKGQVTIVRREYTPAIPLIPVALTEKQQAAQAEAQIEEDTNLDDGQSFIPAPPQLGADFDIDETTDVEDLFANPQ